MIYFMIYVIFVVKDNFFVSEVWDNNGEEVGGYDGCGLKCGCFLFVFNVFWFLGCVVDSFIF